MDEKEAEARPVMGTIFLVVSLFLIEGVMNRTIHIWRASEAGETLSGLFNRESRYLYYSTYVCNICPLTFSDPHNPQRRWSVIFEIATVTLCLHVSSDLFY